MEVQFCFKVRPEGIRAGTRVKVSAGLSVSDIAQLKKLFPGNIAWRGKFTATGIDNTYHLSTERARSLYDAVVKYYVENEVSNKQYLVGSSTDSTVATSNLQSLFDKLLKFFEKDLRFTSSGEAKRAILTKKQERGKRERQDAERRRKEELSIFRDLSLNPPRDAKIRSLLEGQRGQYCMLLKESEKWRHQFSELAFRTDRDYRVTSYKIFIASAVLVAKRKVRLITLVKDRAEKHGDLFNVYEFWDAYEAVARDLKTPLASKIVEVTSLETALLIAR